MKLYRSFLKFFFFLNSSTIWEDEILRHEPKCPFLKVKARIESQKCFKKDFNKRPEIPLENAPLEDIPHSEFVKEFLEHPWAQTETGKLAIRLIDVYHHLRISITDISSPITEYEISH